MKTIGIITVILILIIGGLGLLPVGLGLLFFLTYVGPRKRTQIINANTQAITAHTQMVLFQTAILEQKTKQEEIEKDLL